MTNAWSRLFLMGLLGCAAAPAPTNGEIEFDQTINLVGVSCLSQPRLSWTVTCPDTQESGTAGCEMPVLFLGKQGGQTYKFDIKGYDGTGQLCWEGSCAVRALGDTTLYPDCSREVLRVCP